LRQPELARIDDIASLEGNQLTKHVDLARRSPYVSQIMDLDGHSDALSQSSDYSRVALQITIDVVVAVHFTHDLILLGGSSHRAASPIR
jgi:hypothetical protein